MVLYSYEKEHIGRQHTFIEAIELAARLHAGQFRKDGVTPYIVHPTRVAFTVGTLLSTHDRCIPVSIAAELHDVKEDCGYQGMPAVLAFLDRHTDHLTPEEQELIISIIDLLTLDPKITRKQKIQKCVDDLINSKNHDAVVVKLCDRLDNLQTIGQLDLKFQKTYLAETKNILQSLSVVIKTASSSAPECAWNLLNREYEYAMERFEHETDPVKRLNR